MLLAHLDEYMRHGGYPEVVVHGVGAASYLSTLFESILFKDIVKRYGVRYAAKLHDLGRYLMTNHGREYSFTAVKKALDFRSVHTVENYIGYLDEAFLLFCVRRFSYKAKEQTKAPRKAYPYDLGLVNAVRFKTGSDAGRLLEGLVAIELLRRKEEFFSHKDVSGKDVDFVIRRDGRTSQLIQACYDLADAGTRRRELQALTKAAVNLGCDSLVILTWDTEGDEVLAGRSVQLRPVWKWLLGWEGVFV